MCALSVTYSGQNIIGKVTREQKINIFVSQLMERHIEAIFPKSDMSMQRDDYFFCVSMCVCVNNLIKQTRY